MSNYNDEYLSKFHPAKLFIDELDNFVKNELKTVNQDYRVIEITKLEIELNALLNGRFIEREFIAPLIERIDETINSLDTLVGESFLNPTITIDPSIVDRLDFLKENIQAMMENFGKNKTVILMVDFVESFELHFPPNINQKLKEFYLEPSPANLEAFDKEIMARTSSVCQFSGTNWHDCTQLRNCFENIEIEILLNEVIFS